MIYCADVQWLCRPWVVSLLCPRNIWYLCCPVYMLEKYMLGKGGPVCLKTLNKYQKEKENRIKSIYWDWDDREKRTFLGKSQRTVASDMATKTLNMMQPWMGCLIISCVQVLLPWYSATSSKAWGLIGKHSSERNPQSKVKTNRPSLR